MLPRYVSNENTPGRVCQTAAGPHIHREWVDGFRLQREPKQDRAEQSSQFMLRYLHMNVIWKNTEERDVCYTQKDKILFDFISFSILLRFSFSVTGLPVQRNVRGRPECLAVDACLWVSLPA